jgi:uncharacterized protein (TIGR02271 family)
MLATRTTVVGVFADRASAERAIAELRQAGFHDEHIGMVARDERGRVVDTRTGHETMAEEGATAGVIAGAGIGVAIGAAVVAGTLGTILTNAVAGAAVAGLAGALIGWGIPEEEAKYYESELKAGRFLVTVDAGNRKDEAWTIIHRHGGYNRTTTTERARSAKTGERTMELKEEDLKVRKTPVKKGEVEVRKEVVTEHRQIDVPVEREEVVIERRPARGRAASGDIKSEEIRIPVKEEQVSVEKETVVNEEVSVGKRKVRDVEHVDDTVRREELRVNEKGNARVRQTRKS